VRKLLKRNMTDWKTVCQASNKLVKATFSFDFCDGTDLTEYTAQKRETWIFFRRWWTLDQLNESWKHWLKMKMFILGTLEWSLSWKNLRCLEIKRGEKVEYEGMRKLPAGRKTKEPDNGYNYWKVLRICKRMVDLG